MLSGKKALVTGASKGVGEGCSKVGHHRPPADLPASTVLPNRADKIEFDAGWGWGGAASQLRGRSRPTPPPRRSAGAAIAEALARQGAHVWLVARSEGSLRGTADACRRCGAAGVSTHPCDLSDPRQARSAGRAAAAAFAELLGALTAAL
jgi:NAD(P)-dependent dehydrogenase (short-subunit alcohol dehydrogenase family)